MNKAYSSIKPSDEQLDKMLKLREAFSNLDNLVNELCPASRERSLVITHLETASMWAIKAVTHN